MEIKNNSVYLLYITKDGKDTILGNTVKTVVYVAGIFTSPQLAYNHLAELKEKMEIISSYVREVRVNHPEMMITHFNLENDKEAKWIK